MMYVCTSSQAQLVCIKCDYDVIISASNAHSTQSYDEHFR